MGTPHIEAKKNEIAKIVLMSGDPLRATNYAKKYLKNPKVVNKVRGILAYTGTYNGIEITIMAHGMGLESVGIYVYELYDFYDVDIIVRLGSAGSYTKDLDLCDLMIAEKAFTKSNYGIGYGVEEQTLSATPILVETLKTIVKENPPKSNYKFATCNSSMWFYQTDNFVNFEEYSKKNILTVEMEAYALYLLANKFNKKAITILTISDNLVTKKELSPEERATLFWPMMEIILKMIEKLVKDEK